MFLLYLSIEDKSPQNKSWGTVKNIENGLIHAYRDITFQNLNKCAVSDSKLSICVNEAAKFLRRREENYHFAA